jgi:hypothetical protein
MEAGEEGCAWNRALFEAGAEHRTWIPTTALFHVVLCTQNTVGRFYQFYMYI